MIRYEWDSGVVLYSPSMPSSVRVYEPYTPPELARTNLIKAKGQRPLSRERLSPATQLSYYS
jgi:hypothetical protein